MPGCLRYALEALSQNNPPVSLREPSPLPCRGDTVNSNPPYEIGGKRNEVKQGGAFLRQWNLN
jgi:hypothetical protein